MKTRMPSWCDRVLFTPPTKDIFAKVRLNNLYSHTIMFQCANFAVSSREFVRLTKTPLEIKYLKQVVHYGVLLVLFRIFQLSTA